MTKHAKKNFGLEPPICCLTQPGRKRRKTTWQFFLSFPAVKFLCSHEFFRPYLLGHMKPCASGRTVTTSASCAAQDRGYSIIICNCYMRNVLYISIYWLAEGQQLRTLTADEREFTLSLTGCLRYCNRRLEETSVESH